MSQDQPIFHDPVYVTANGFLSASYARTIKDLNDSSAHARYGERAKEQIDILSDFFNQVKSDMTIFQIRSAADITRLTEAYYLNSDYKPIITAKTFELCSTMGTSQIEHLAKLYGSAFKLMNSNSVAGIDIVDLTQSLSANPWLIMLITTIFTRVESEDRTGE